MSLDTVQSAVHHYLSTEVVEFKINFLPHELLPKIFKRLNAHDRKNVRLTCRLWNEVCKLREIIEYEKFVFHLGKEGCGFPDLMGAHIEECEALRSCLEFQGLPLWRLPSTLWANIGERVQSLFIHECEVDDATILNIIIHCINLKTLHLQSVTHDLCGIFVNSYENNTDVQPNSSATLSDRAGEFFTEEGITDELIKRNIERRNLTSLILYSHEAKSISTKKLRKLYQIFPCLQTLGQGMLIFESHRTTGFDLFHLSKIEWVFPPTMENFVSNVEDDIVDFFKRSNSKLKEFSTFLDLDSVTHYDLFLNLCYEQKELEKLALHVVGCYDRTDNILFLILRSFPKLKELELHGASLPEFWYSPEKLSEFFILTSKLESMWLDNLPEKFTPIIPLPAIPVSPLAEYSTLKSLTVSHLINLNLIYEILRRCRTSLHHLHVMKVNDEIIQLILQAHTELKTLRISQIDLRKRSKDGSTPAGKKYPFGKLRNLEHLDIGSIDPDTLRNNGSEFIFPKLKRFDFNHCFTHILPYLHNVAVQDFHTMLRVVCKGAPYLETLKMCAPTFELIDIVDCFRNVQMKSLRYITFYGLLLNPYTEGFRTSQSYIHSDSIDALFNLCPSLCSISFGWGGCCTYFYNRHSKEVKYYPDLKIFDSIETVPSISYLIPYSDTL